MRSLISQSFSSLTICVSAGYADITEDIAQKASCLAPKTFASTFRTVKTALNAPRTQSSSSPSKSVDENGPTTYAKLISEYKIGQPLRVESWMKDAQAALFALPQFQKKFSSRITESGAEVRIAVFVWVCKAIKVCKRELPVASISPLSIKKQNKNL
jgi:hypothetical protein